MTSRIEFSPVCRRTLPTSSSSSRVVYVERPESNQVLVAEAEEFGAHVEFGGQTIRGFHAREYPSVSSAPGSQSARPPASGRERATKGAKRKKRQAARAARKKNRGK
jgi:hypothetical protein